MANIKRYYIAYGSNLNIPQMRMRCPGARVPFPADLHIAGGGQAEVPFLVHDVDEHPAAANLAKCPA